MRVAKSKGKKKKKTKKAEKNLFFSLIHSSNYVNFRKVAKRGKIYPFFSF